MDLPAGRLAGALADQEVLDLVADADSDAYENDADDDAPQGVIERVGREKGKQYRHKSHGQTQEGGQVLAEDHQELALAARPEPPEEALTPPCFIHLSQAAGQGNRFKDNADAENHQGHRRVLQLLRSVHLLDALVNREKAPEGEEDYRHDEGPEINRHAVPEGMLGVGRLPGPFYPVQEQALVGAVRRGMHRLGEHCAGAGHHRRYEFRQGDQ